MIIVGAKGFAKEVLEVLNQQQKSQGVFFFDNISTDLTEKVFDKYEIIKSQKHVSQIFKQKDKNFVLGVGDPKTRMKLYEFFLELGGELESVISPKSNIGKFGISLDIGVTIMTGCVLTSDIILKKGVLLNLNCTVGHDSFLEEFVECSPGVHISGHVKVGRGTQIGSGAVILPGVEVGKNCVIGAGAVITKHIPDNSLAVGVPGRVIKDLNM